LKFKLSFFNILWELWYSQRILSNCQG